MGYYPLRPLFQSGEILFSPAVNEIEIKIIKQLLHRHFAGCWGEDLSPEDLKANEQAIENGEAILSQYQVTGPDGDIRTITIMTEADRSFTVFFILGEPGFPSAEA